MAHELQKGFLKRELTRAITVVCGCCASTLRGTVVENCFSGRQGSAEQGGVPMTNADVSVFFASADG
jgi:hypothetical protein